MTTPIAVIRACAAMMPQLQAEESLLAFQRTAVGSGSLAKDDAQAILRGWERQAFPERPHAVVRNPSRDELRAMGVGVRVVKKVKGDGRAAS